MTALSAVEPEGVGVVDLDGVGGDHAHRGRGGHGLEAGVEAGSVAVHGDGLAWLVEGGLSDGVVASEELELDKLAWGGLDVVGGKGEAAVLRNGDNPGSLGGGQARESGKGKCLELHFEVYVCVILCCLVIK